MIHNTFVHSFHSLIDPPNKEELLYALENAPLTKDQYFEWTLNCSVTTERLDLDLDVFFPSLDLFFKDLEANANLNISLHEVWRNTYSKGYFQELHDHLPLHLSGVVFLTDWKEAVRFIEYLGFKREGFHQKYGPNETDYYTYAKIYKEL